jgi:hypothetical protein
MQCRIVPAAGAVMVGAIALAVTACGVAGPMAGDAAGDRKHRHVVARTATQPAHTGARSASAPPQDHSRPLRQGDGLRIG